MQEPLLTKLWPNCGRLYGYIRRNNYCGIGVLTYGRTGYCLRPLHLRHQHVNICPDVDVRTVTLHIRDSKFNANLRVTLRKRYDAPKYGGTQQMSAMIRAGRWAYGKSKIRGTTIFKICKQDSSRYLRNSAYLKINQMRYYVLLVDYILTYINKFRIPEDISILDFQVQAYSRCIFIHKIHKEQMENSF